MRVFLDANILFSAAKSDGAMRRFLEILKNGGHTLVADGFVTAEATRNLLAKAPFATSCFEEVMKSVESSTGTSTLLCEDIAPSLETKDRPVLAAAIERRCDVLLTGDKAHFGEFYGQVIEGVEIHSPSSLAIKLQKR